MPIATAANPEAAKDATSTISISLCMLPHYVILNCFDQRRVGKYPVYDIKDAAKKVQYRPSH